MPFNMRPRRFFQVSGTVSTKNLLPLNFEDLILTLKSLIFALIPHIFTWENCNSSIFTSVSPTVVKLSRFIFTVTLLWTSFQGDLPWAILCAKAEKDPFKTKCYMTVCVNWMMIADMFLMCVRCYFYVRYLVYFYWFQVSVAYRIFHIISCSEYKSHQTVPFYCGGLCLTPDAHELQGN